MSLKNDTEFSRLRSFFWPIHRKEIKKFVPLFILYALICFNYSLLKAAKDTLVITAPESGVAAIPFIKTWVILPMAFLTTFFFTYLVNKYNQEKVFYIIIGGFLSFFLVFATILYPLRHAIHPHIVADQIQHLLPQGFRGFISIFRNWSYTLFYVMADLWATTVVSVLFWSFSNEIMKLKDAKKIYGIFGVGANIAAIFSGQIVIILSGDLLHFSFLFGEDRWGRCLGLMTTVIVLVGLFIIAIFRWYNVHVLNRALSLKVMQKEYRNENRSFINRIYNDFTYLAKSKYLLCIAIIVISFNLAINMIEIVWKDRVYCLYPNPNDFNAYMGQVLIAIGIVSSFIGFFFCGNIIRRLGWTFSALITPVTLLVTGMFFFGVLLVKENAILTFWATLTGLTPLAIGALFGTVQSVLSRACKYTLFDATKEISFIPLDSEHKLKGKAAIDGIGSHVGKTGGSIVHSGLLMFFGTISYSTPFVVILLILIVCGWIIATLSLGRKFSYLNVQNEKV